MPSRISLHGGLDGSATLTIDYDALDLLARTTHPDTTYGEDGYQRLGLVTRRGRLGRTTRLYYDD